MYLLGPICLVLAGTVAATAAAPVPLNARFDSTNEVDAPGPRGWKRTDNTADGNCAACGGAGWKRDEADKERRAPPGFYGWKTEAEEKQDVEDAAV